jgi:hypothetical protein
MQSVPPRENPNQILKNRRQLDFVPVFTNFLPLKALRSMFTVEKKMTKTQTIVHAI